MEAPPPLPPPLPSPAPQPEKYSSFPLQAANACLAAPLLMLTFLLLTSALAQGHRDNSRLSLMLTIDLVSFLILVTGVIFGILAIVLARPGQRASVIARAAVGLLLAAVPFAIAIPNFVRAREKALDTRQAFQRVDDEVRAVREQSVQSLRDGRQEPVSLDGIDRALGEAAQKASGENAALMRGTQAYFQRMQGLKVNYERAAEKLTAAKVLDTGSLASQEQLRERQGLAREFLAANANLREFVSKNDENYAGELVKARVPPENVDVALAAFHRNSAPQVPLILEVRDSNERIARAMLGIFELLENEWGHWETNPENHKLVFHTQSAVRQYNDYLDEIKRASAGQAESQKRLAALISEQNRGQ